MSAWAAPDNTKATANARGFKTGEKVSFMRNLLVGG
jgi:hypothetical protein